MLAMCHSESTSLFYSLEIAKECKGTMHRNQSHASSIAMHALLQRAICGWICLSAGVDSSLSRWAPLLQLERILLHYRFPGCVCKWNRRQGCAPGPERSYWMVSTFWRGEGKTSQERCYFLWKNWGSIYLWYLPNPHYHSIWASHNHWCFGRWGSAVLLALLHRWGPKAQRG